MTPIWHNLVLFRYAVYLGIFTLYCTWQKEEKLHQLMLELIFFFMNLLNTFILYIYIYILSENSETSKFQSKVVFLYLYSTEQKSWAIPYFFIFLFIYLFIEKLDQTSSLLPFVWVNPQKRLMATLYDGHKINSILGATWKFGIS